MTVGFKINKENCSSNKYEAFPGYHSDDEPLLSKDSSGRKWRLVKKNENLSRPSAETSKQVNTDLAKLPLGSAEKKPPPSPSLDLDFYGSSPSKEKNKLHSHYLKNIEKVSQKILVTEAKLTTKLSEGTEVFLGYINTQIKKFSAILDVARKEYAHVASHYFGTQSLKLSSLENSRINPFYEKYTEGFIMKVVKKSLLALATESPKGSGVAITVNSLDKKNITILANWGKTSRLRIVRWSGKFLPEDPNIFIARGGFGVVQKVFDISIGNVAVLKIAKSLNEMRDEMSVEFCENEIKKLELFNSCSSVDGIQNAPWVSYNFTYENKAFVGFLQRLYSEGDLYTLIFDRCQFQFTKIKMLRMIQQLFIGLNQIHTKNMIHGDIKLENILINFDGVNFNACLGDFGGAKFLGSEISILNQSKGTSVFATIVTIDYYTFGDYKESIQVVRGNKQEEWFKLLKKRDIYALATVAWAIITRDLPYRRWQGHSFPDTTVIMNYDTAKQKVGEELAAVILKALSENPNERPTIEEILCQIDSNIAPSSK